MVSSISFWKISDVIRGAFFRAANTKISSKFLFLTFDDIDTVMLVDKYLNDNEIANLQIDQRLVNLDTNFLNSLSDTYHQCGGMRMSTDSEKGVVDPDRKVWGTSNVWALVAMVFPPLSYANCTLTGLALAVSLVCQMTKCNAIYLLKILLFQFPC